ncbi:MAG: YraN family protein [Phycisphaerales bacterium]|nr:YraN family protein [Phycisphaerales bacterium]
MAEPRPTPPPPASLLARVASLLRRTPPTLGQRGERAAARHLKRAGYRVLARNLHLANAEADIVALTPDRRTVVVVEVKTRLLSTAHPPPEASITARKQAALVRLAQAIASRTRRRRPPGSAPRGIRIDVIGVDWPGADAPRGSAPAIRHHVGAVGQRA